MEYPLVHEITYQDPLAIFALFAEQEGAVFLDSAELRPQCGRYSFIAVDPFLQFSSPQQDVFATLEQQFGLYPMKFHANLPPFQGGAAGYLSYDLCHQLEHLPRAQVDDMQFADMMLGFYDLVIAFDHDVQRAWVFSSGLPMPVEQREQHAQQRLQSLLKQIAEVPKLIEKSSAVCKPTAIQANFSAAEYQAAVKQTIEYILAGDIFEANLSQRFHCTLPEGLSSFDLYQRLRLCNPAPFAAYVKFSDTVLASASPERFLQLKQGQVETRPIKGTRARGKTAAEDLALQEALLASSKDRAENIMIVDLMRNDLSRVCRDHTVDVPQLCGLESYASVHHLVSVVKGTLKEDHNAIDLIKATFPGGSITGAPKLRAMEIIAELESTARGPYCGSIGYIGFNGDMDLSITIRTFAIKKGIVTFQAGGAVVADSDPLQEYEETLTKAKALKRALTEVLN